jgi:glucosylceramidase
VPIGSTDYGLSYYSYDDLPSGQTDPTLASFSVAHDQAYVIPLIAQAKQLNPGMKLMATPWSPPGWMKSSGSLLGGSLLPTMYTPFANYLVRFVQAYSAAGIPIDYISLQNEPEYDQPGFPGMIMDAPTQIAVLRDYVLPRLSASGVTARVLVYDSNWDDRNYAPTVLADPTIQNSTQVAGTAWHGYQPWPGIMTLVRDSFPNAGAYETEHSGFWANDQVLADFPEITDVMRNWGKTFLKWSAALNENHGPIGTNSPVASPLVTVNSTSGAITYAIDYYTLGHFSRFVLPGAYRIYSSNGSGILSVAFINPDRSKALVAYNDSSSSQTFQVQWGTYSLSYTLPALSGATFTWSGAQNGGYAVGAGTQILASSYNGSQGIYDYPQTYAYGGYVVLEYAAAGAYGLYKNVDFGSGFGTLSASLSCDPTVGHCGGTIEFHLDSATGPLAGSMTVPATGGWLNWQTVQSTVSASATGVHDLYLVFKAPSAGATNLAGVRWFQFAGAVAGHGVSAPGGTSPKAVPSPGAGRLVDRR